MSNHVDIDSIKIDLKLDDNIDNIRIVDIVDWESLWILKIIIEIVVLSSV